MRLANLPNLLALIPLVCLNKEQLSRADPGTQISPPHQFVRARKPDKRGTLGRLRFVKRRCRLPLTAKSFLTNFRLGIGRSGSSQKSRDLGIDCSATV
jgi:hypothetical protein